MWGTRTTRGVGAIALGALVLGAAGCSGDDEATSDRRCAVVQAGELSDIVGADLELAKAGEDKRVCEFSSEDGSTSVILTVDGPVEVGLPELLLTDPQRLEGIGNEAWYARRDVPLDVRGMVRRGGSLLTIDLRVPGTSNDARKALVREIAEAGVGELPTLKAAAADGPRGDDACAGYDTSEIAAALGGVPVVGPVAPPGSCELVVEQADVSVRVTVLLDENATEQSLEQVVAAIEDPLPVEVDGNPAFWIEPPDGATGGQLDVLDGDRLVQVAVIGASLDEEESLAAATTVAEAAVGTTD